MRLKTTEAEIAAHREEYGSGGIFWLAVLNEVGLKCDPPAGAFYAFPNVEKIHKNSRTAAQILLEEGAHRHHSGVGVRRAGRRASSLRLCHHDQGN